jgi:uncharacterized protein
MKQNIELNQLDILNFAQSSGALSGKLPLLGFERLCAEDSRKSPEESINWSLNGQQIKTPDGINQIWLHLKANTHVMMTCQRCLELASFDLNVDRSFRFVDNEATALEQDDENEEDLLVMYKKFNTLELIEDELIMSLPIVPRHQVCQNLFLEDLAKEGQENPEFQRPNPFAVLANLKKSTKT